MSSSADPGKKRTWEDWTSLALGIAIALGPWILDETSSSRVVANAAVAGVVVMVLAELDLVSTRRWVELAQLAVGLWIVFAALALGSSGGGDLRTWHIGAGSLVVLLALAELRRSGAR